MNIIEYIKLKKAVKQMPPEQLAWNLFATTGKVNYYLLYSAIKDNEKELKWTNTESREL